MVYLCTGFTMLPLHRNDGMEPKRCLAYATEIADFYRMQIVAKKFLSRGQNGRVGRVSGNKTFFFFFCLNDLPDQVKSRVRLLADDTSMCLAISSEGESITLQNDLHTLEIWEKRSDLSFNPSKCQVLHITSAKCPIQTRYILHGTVLDSVPSAKYLGVTISNNLSWTPHIDSVSKNS